jgi:hypothetical protein
LNSVEKDCQVTIPGLHTARTSLCGRSLAKSFRFSNSQLT